MAKPPYNVIDADKLTGPLVWCVISGGEDGWNHCDVTTSGRTSDEAKAAAQTVVDQIFPGKRKLVRTAAYGEESVDFEKKCRVVRGGARFHFHTTEAGEIDALPEGMNYVSYGR